MSSGFYTTYLGMQARQDAMDVVANNLANVNTTGFKTDNPFFSAYQNALDNPASQTNIDKSTQLENIKTDFSTGSFRSTGRELDVAIEGDGFFVVNTPSGERYTRDGSFTLNSNGQLVTEQGYQVIGQGGPITVPPGAVTIDPAGDISVNGQSIGTLRIVKFANNASLRKEGNNVFQQTDSKMQAVAVQYPNIQQGQLESSNVNAIKEMVTMMKYMREFESLQKVLTSMNNDTNSSQMGRLSS
ncbi:MAG TPA: flagellar basal-body rod protein FlgF [Blastocatellia bacterium]|nr:flagellar basal-body rod protein FlgF [Blastocatellia bacterium]